MTVCIVADCSLLRLAEEEDVDAKRKVRRKECVMARLSNQVEPMSGFSTGKQQSNVA